MEEAFGYVLFAVVAIAAVVAVASLGLRRRAYDEIGKGGLSMDRDPGRAEPAGAAGRAMREEEIRQMLEARNVRRAARGEAPLDVDAELARLTAAPVAADPELLEEVRALVAVRNERRRRRGEPPLDVEAEVARQLRELRSL